MPGRNGTGPMGAGPMTGRGLGLCTGANAGWYGAGRGFGAGQGLACRRGFGQRFGSGIGLRFGLATSSSEARKEQLEAQKDLLQNRIDEISDQLENL